MSEKGLQSFSEDYGHKGRNRFYHYTQSLQAKVTLNKKYIKKQIPNKQKNPLC